MGLISHGLVFGLGLVLGRPDGRQKLVELVHHPKAKELRDRGQDLARDGLQATRRRLNRRDNSAATGEAEATATTSPSPSRPVASQDDVVPPVVGFGGTTVEEDTTAAITGLPPLPRADLPQPPAGDRTP